MRWPCAGRPAGELLASQLHAPMSIHEFINQSQKWLGHTRAAESRDASTSPGRAVPRASWSHTHTMRPAARAHAQPEGEGGLGPRPAC